MAVVSGFGLKGTNVLLKENLFSLAEFAVKQHYIETRSC